MDGLVAFVMSLAADKLAAEGCWVKFSKITKQVCCASPTECLLLANSDLFPKGFRPLNNLGGLDQILLPDADQIRRKGTGFMDKIKDMVYT